MPAEYDVSKRSVASSSSFSTCCGTGVCDAECDAVRASLMKRRVHYIYKKGVNLNFLSLEHEKK